MLRGRYAPFTLAGGTDTSASPSSSSWTASSSSASARAIFMASASLPSVQLDVSGGGCGALDATAYSDLCELEETRL